MAVVVALAIGGALITIGGMLIGSSLPATSDARPSPAHAPPTSSISTRSFPAFAGRPSFEYADRPGQLAFSISQGPEAGIYLANADGSSPRSIAASSVGPGFYGPEWSPDGRHLIYHDSGSIPEILVADASGNVQFAVAGCCPAFSLDGSLLATLIVDSHTGGHKEGDGLQSATLLITAMDGSIVQRTPLEDLRVGNLVQLFWTPNGRAIALDDLLRPTGAGPQETWWLTMGSNDLLPYPVKPLYGARHFFSPDGSRVVGMAHEAYVVQAADGSRARTVIPSTTDWYSSAWSPDGVSIALLAGRGNDPALHIVDAGTGAVSPAIDGLPPIGYILDWSPNDGRILLSAGTGLWTIESNGANPRLLIEGADDGHWQPLLQADP